MVADEELAASVAPPSSLLVARVCAVLLGVVAAGCWLAASVSGLQLQVGQVGAWAMHWWSGLTVAAGIGVAIVMWFAAGRGGRLAVLTVLSVLLMLGCGVLVFALVVMPEPSPIHPIGPGVPYAYAGFVAAGLACLVTLIALAAAGRGMDASAPRDARRPRTARLVAVAVSAGLIVAAGWVVVDRSQDYLLGVNEYRSGEGVDRPAAAPPTSTLGGGDRWRVSVPGATLAQPAVTAYGIALASGQNVVMIDRATGRERWRYTRSDVAGPPAVASTDSGRQVLVWWGPAVYVLDARTGQRIGHWPEREPASILDPALPVVARTDSHGETTIDRLNRSGAPVWSYRLGACARARARLAGERGRGYGVRILWPDGR